MILAWNQLVRWFDPWPISMKRKTRFRVSVIPMNQAVRFLAYWPHNGVRKPIKEVAKLILKKDFNGKRHQVESIMRHLKCQIPVLLVSKGRIVLDGNHRLCAAFLDKYQGPVVLVRELKSGDE